MKLTKITVYGLFGECDYEIPLNVPITYVHSQNGLGKSTLMKLVSNVLSGNIKEVESIPFERIDLEFTDKIKLFVEKHGKKIKLQMSRNELEENIKPEEVKNLQPCVYISPERQMISQGNGIFKEQVITYINEFFESLAEMKNNLSIPTVPKNDIPMTEAETDKLLKDVAAKIDFIRNQGIEPELPNDFRFPPTRYEISQNKEGYRKLALSVKEWTDKYYQFAENIVVYKDIINDLFVNKTIKINQGGSLQAQMDNSGTPIKMESLSSGEKQIMIIFYILLFRIKNDSVVIIDEPEVSLHVSWQQKLGKLFSDIQRLKNLTVIVATHAPAVIHQDWDCAVELRNLRE